MVKLYEGGAYLLHGTEVTVSYTHLTLPTTMV